MSVEPDAAPAFRVVAGHPSDEELAALVVVLTAAATAPATPAPPPVSAWAAAARQGRPVLTPGPGAWVASARPH